METTYFSDKELEVAKRVVAAGMAYLDETYPDHRERFNPALFDIMHPRQCALAQAAQTIFWRTFVEGLEDDAKRHERTNPDWNRALGNANKRHNWDLAHGFLAMHYVDDVYLSQNLLNYVWLKAYEFGDLVLS